MRSCVDWEAGEAGNFRTEGVRPALQQASKKGMNICWFIQSIFIIIPTRQQVLTRMRGSVGYLDATDECEDVNTCTSAKGRRINVGKPASSIPISTTQFLPVQIRYQTNQAPKPYVPVSTTNISTTKSAHITGTS